MRTSIVFGLLNAAVGLWATYVLAPQVGRYATRLRAQAVLVLGILAAGYLQVDRLTFMAEEELFADPIVFKKVEYESPIDQHYKDFFEEERVIETLRELDMDFSHRRTDFLAYPLTGCYAGSAFGRSPRLMRFLLLLERTVERIPLLRRLAQIVSWRFLIVATKKRETP